MQIELKQFSQGQPLSKQKQIPSANIKNDTLPSPTTTQNFPPNYLKILQSANSMPQGLPKYLLATQALLHLRDWPKLLYYSQQGLLLAQQPQLYHLKGKALGKMGQLQSQLTLIQKAISLRPDKPTYHRNLGAAHYQLKNYQNAIQAHSKAIQLQPQNPINHHNKGSAYYRLKQYKKALECFEEAVRINSKQSLSYSWMGDCQKQLGRVDDALKSYQMAYEISGNQIYLRQRDKLLKFIEESNRPTN